jgi:hypothetical protein
VVTAAHLTHRGAEGAEQDAQGLGEAAVGLGVGEDVGAVDDAVDVEHALADPDGRVQVGGSAQLVADGVGSVAPQGLAYGRPGRLGALVVLGALLEQRGDALASGRPRGDRV